MKYNLEIYLVLGNGRRLRGMEVVSRGAVLGHCLSTSHPSESDYKIDSDYINNYLGELSPMEECSIIQVHYLLTDVVQ